MVEPSPRKALGIERSAYGWRSAKNSTVIEYERFAVPGLTLYTVTTCPTGDRTKACVRMQLSVAGGNRPSAKNAAKSASIKRWKATPHEPTAKVARKKGVSLSGISRDAVPGGASPVTTTMSTVSTITANEAAASPIVRMRTRGPKRPAEGRAAAL